jgi:hypothetical protein
MKRIIATLFAFLVLSITFSGFVHAQPVDPALRPAIIAQERNNSAILALPGVVGTAVGVDATGAPVVKIYTERGAVPGLPRTLEGIPVQVEVTGRIFAFQSCTGPPWTRPPACNGGGGGGEEPPPDEPTEPDEPAAGTDPTARFERPVPIGVSTGHPDITAGTICCRVRSANGATTYALSNNHVYADQNRANLGDHVLQPGPYDGGKDPGDRIGQLSDFEHIVFSRQAQNVVDAAIAVVQGTLDTTTPEGGYGSPRSTPVSAVPGMNVMKFGRSTELTKGYVDAINATVQIRFERGFARFVQQIVIKPGSFSAPGDSGSLIVADGGVHDRKPVGLLFAGSSSVTIANPIQAVLDKFSVVIDGDD